MRVGRGARIVLAGVGVAAALIGAGLWWSRDGARPRAELARPVPEAAVVAETPAQELAALPEPTARAGERRAGIAVRVVSDERAVEGARVLFHGTELPPLTTDGEGRCVLALAPQRALDLEVTADGYCGLRDEFRWGDEVVVDLAPCALLEGRVLDLATREPIAGARVHVWRAKRWVPLAAEAVTDSDGRFRIDCAPRDADVRVAARGYPDWGEVLSRSTPDGLELLLVARPTLEVQVVEHGTRVPIAGAEVNGCCTDAEGRTHIGGPEDPLDLFYVNAEAAGFCGVGWSEFPDRLPQGLVLELPRVAWIEGVVRDDAGQPVNGAHVALHWDYEIVSAGLPPLRRGCSYSCSDPETAVTEADGSYRSGPLVPGSGHYEVEAQHPDAGVCRTTLESAGAPGSATRLDFTLQRLEKGAVAGRVLFNGAASLAKLWLSDGWDRQLADTDLDGAYRFENVAAGIVKLELRSKQLEPIRALLPEMNVELRVEAGATTRHDFVVDVPFADIGGRVTYANGEPADGKKIRIEHGSVYDNDDTTGSNGRWSERVPDVGWEYDVVLEHGDERWRVTGVRAGDGEVNFVLPATARLPVRIVDDESGALVEEVRYTWTRPDGTSQRGSARRATDSATFTLEVLPGVIAELVVEPDDDAYPSARRGGIEVQPGDNPMIEIRLRKGHDLVIEVAPGLEAPRIDRECILLLESDRWDTVRTEGEAGANPTFRMNMGGLRSFSLDRGRFTELELVKRMLCFDAGIARLQGLAPGRYRFKAFPAGTTVEPAEVEIPHEGRLVLSWARGD